MITQIEMQYMEAVKRIARVMSEPKDVDWEQRRYEIAKECYVRNVGMERGALSAELIAKESVMLADALVSELRNQNVSKC